ncbi:phage tail protein [Calidithermus chliarophilus]|uniref:phage tail protein n=1 Tax=Calidithermus chliarophilus TaxID=52023 RepID=UPI0003FC852C|nr:tail fiber protein [Calidithermus chliarophilus]
MSDPFIAEIRIVGFQFAPRGWARCDGQLLPINQNTLLFSLLGTTYGGNGRTTFALPDLRGRAPVQPGQGPGLSNRTLGQSGGSQTVTLLQTQIPAHNHALRAVNDLADSSNPGGSLARAAGVQPYGTGSPNAVLAPQSVGAAGGSQPHNNLQPYLMLNFVIALQGVFPQRS